MASAHTTKTAPFETIADLLRKLGRISPRRIRAVPPPGRATEKDLIALHNRTDRLYELVDGVLVEKIMSFPESALAVDLIRLLGNYLDKNDVGLMAGADGGMRLLPGLVRLPDVSFVRWERLPAREIPLDPIAGLAPDLAVEVLSKGNTKGEMARKLREYFLAGVRLVWFVDPRRRAVQVFTAPDESVTLAEGQTLDGGEVLPGLSLSVRELFAHVPRTAGRNKRPPRGAAGR
jgi:Uma2 family endonuclease